MDLSSVFAVLQQADKQAQETNPYLGFQNIGDQLGQLVVKQSGQLDGDGNQRNGFGDILGAGLLTGLLSGGAGVAARGYQADQNKLALDSLSQILRGGDIQQPEGMAPNVFNAIRGPASLIRAQQNLENQQLMLKGNQDLRNKVLGTVVEEAVKNPYRPGSQEVLAGLGLGANPTPQPVAGNKEPSAAPASGQMTVEDYMKKYQGNKELADAAAKRDLEAPDRNRNEEDKLRTQLLALKPVQEFGEISKQYAALQKAESDPSSISDLDFTIGSMKILDPQSIVRESEQGMVFESQSVPSQLLGRINAIISGKAKLTPDVRSEILDLAQRRYDVQRQIVDASSDAFRKIAEDRGLDPNKVLLIPQATIAERKKVSLEEQGAPGLAQNKQATGSMSGIVSSVDLAPGVKQFTFQNGKTGSYKMTPNGYQRIQ
jgi:hypothetical protein